VLAYRSCFDASNYNPVYAAGLMHPKIYENRWDSHCKGHTHPLINLFILERILLSGSGVCFLEKQFFFPGW
jgi:hypothetical protein